MSSRQQRNPKSQPGNKVELQFVTVVPNDPNLNTANHSVIRANAAHFHWRHNRPPRGGSKLAKKSQGGPSSISSLAKLTYGIPNRQAANRIRSLQGSTPSQLECGGLIDQPSSEEVDPFSSYECNLPRGFVSRCITFNARVILPAMFPDADHINTKSAILQLSLSNPCIMHMFIIGALSNSPETTRISSRSMALIKLQSRSEIVKRMCIIMKNPNEAAKDINIFAIGALAKNGELETRPVPLKTPIQGPLRSLQFLNRLGLMDEAPVHYHALTKLIELKGGLENIKLPGLAALISYGGLRYAVRNLTSPCYPVVTLSCPTEEFIFQHRGTGFGTDPDLYRCLSMLNSYTIMIDDHCDGRKVVAASVLIDHRNTTQHTLLSLPPKAGSSECLRLAALIYSFLVTFPLPYVAAPFQKLVTQLRTALDDWNNGDEMLLWVLAIGGIGAVGLSERAWYVGCFRRAVIDMEIRSWPEAKILIKRGLWYEPTNDRDAYDIWIESQGIGN